MNRGEIIDFFDSCEHPEHVKNQLEPILEAANQGAGLSDDEWETVFESLATDVEMGHADWANQ